jgi:hypothetical protein
MLNELIKEKLEKYLEKQYNIYVVISGALISGAIISAGFSLFLSPNLLFISFILYFIYIIFLVKFKNKLYKKSYLLIKNALELGESRRYFATLYDEYELGLSFIESLEEEPEVLDDAEEQEKRRIKASMSIYRYYISAVKSRIWTVSLTSAISALILSFMINNILMKIIYIIFFSIILIYLKISRI